VHLFLGYHVLLFRLQVNSMSARQFSDLISSCFNFDILVVSNFRLEFKENKMRGEWVTCLLPSQYIM